MRKESLSIVQFMAGTNRVHRQSDQWLTLRCSATWFWKKAKFGASALFSFNVSWGGRDGVGGGLGSYPLIRN